MVNVVAAYVSVMRKFNGDVLCDSETTTDAVQLLYESARVLREPAFHPSTVREAAPFLTAGSSGILSNEGKSWRHGARAKGKECSFSTAEDLSQVLSRPDFVVEAMKDTWLLFNKVLEKKEMKSSRPLQRAEKKLWFLLIWANSDYTADVVSLLRLSETLALASIES